MSASDFFCLPSYREGFPASILEASATGIPTIGSSIYGICDAIQADKTGILVNPRDAQALSQAIELLYQNSDLRDSLGRGAREMVSSQFQQDIVVTRYVDYFSLAVQSKRLNVFYRGAKRFIDIILSLFAGFALAIPMLFIAIAVAVSSKGPIIYSSNRVGRNNTPFKMAKFRSMKIGAPVLATDQLTNPEQFITPIGRFLRKSSLDELPQLWNIFKGDMSFVGPRPALFNQYGLIDMRANAGIDALRPGLTGLAQVNGRDNISNLDKVKYDSEYLQNASLLLDIRILGLTLIKVFRGDGVMH